MESSYQRRIEAVKQEAMALTAPIWQKSAP
jgi:hypothetical protein